jgi:hypothetical protein
MHSFGICVIIHQTQINSMKKTQLLFLVSIFFIAVSNAQINKGAVLLGSDLYGYTEKTTSSLTSDAEITYLVISPMAGFAIKENLVIGGDLMFGFTEFDNPAAYDAKGNAYGAGFFVRKYKPVGKNGFYIFAQGRLGGSFEKNKQISAAQSDIDRRYTIGMSIYPGISYAISKKFHLEAGLANLLNVQYRSEKREFEGIVDRTEKKRRIELNSSLSGFSNIFAGFRVLLN